eukprot:NODE_1686_length_505_cov_14.017544_g1608_i0.p1 GENE.NODE_1686_length_505_cov_14.017544_g1608_i0~~NODE_1686_length_505_cov_14.017544_g1608_i0.p1  ORF type:complete len:53 (-),score=5.30 NODE_1686_length_505_cov_14.017544_g1608_i0:85-243(-)
MGGWVWVWGCAWHTVCSRLFGCFRASERKLHDTALFSTRLSSPLLPLPHTRQ